MGQVHDVSATTTAAVRRAIQHSQESLRVLARRYGINQKTVAKWKKRTSVADLPTGPREPRSTVLTVEEEAVILGGSRERRLRKRYRMSKITSAPPALSNPRSFSLRLLLSCQKIAKRICRPQKPPLGRRPEALLRQNEQSCPCKGDLFNGNHRDREVRLPGLPLLSCLSA